MTLNRAFAAIALVTLTLSLGTCGDDDEPDRGKAASTTTSHTTATTVTTATTAPATTTTTAPPTTTTTPPPTTTTTPPPAPTTAPPAAPTTDLSKADEYGCTYANGCLDYNGPSSGELQQEYGCEQGYITEGCP